MTSRETAQPTLTLTGAGVISAGVGWGTLVIVGRAFGPQIYAEFMVWWSFYFAAVSVLVGLQQVVASSELQPSTWPEERHPLREFLALTVPLGLLAWVALGRLVPSPELKLLAVLLPTTLVLAGCLVVASETLGMLTAQGRWATLGSLSVADAALRLAFVVAFIALAPTPVGYIAGVFASVVAFLPLVLRGEWRFGPQAHFGGRGFVLRASGAMVGAGCLGVLTVGMPAVIHARGAVPTDMAAPLFATLVLLRSPVLILAGAIRPLVLRRSAAAASTEAALWIRRHVLAALATLGMVSLGSWALGPDVVGLLFGSDYRPTRADAAAVGASGLLLAAMTVSGTALVATGRDRFALAGWLLSVAVTVATLWLPLPFAVRTELSLVLGPAVGLSLHAFCAQRYGVRAD